MTSRVAFTIVIGVVLGACSVVVDGSGVVTVEERPVDQFTEIELQGSGSVILAQDRTFRLEIEAEDNVLEFLETEVSDDRLLLGRTGGRIFRVGEPIVYRVSAPAVSVLEVSGSGEVQAGDVSGERLDVRVSGSGSVVLTGEVDRLRVEIDGSGTVTITGQGTELRVEISGSGEFIGTEFAVEEADVRVSGSGSAIVAPISRLDAAVSGSGSVLYLGEPERIESDISGSGSVERR